MNIDLPQITASAVVVVPIIVAIVQAIKLTNWKGMDRFAPLISIGVGIIIGFLADHNSADLTATILSGAMYLWLPAFIRGLKRLWRLILKQRPAENTSDIFYLDIPGHCFV
jgi:uncharacterized ion transporter superfamily protein YfcC